MCLPEENALFYCAEVALLLNHCHLRGVSFGSITCADVLLMSNGHIKLDSKPMAEDYGTNNMEEEDTTATWSVSGSRLGDMWFVTYHIFISCFFHVVCHLSYLYHVYVLCVYV